MKGAELRRIRKRLGLTQKQMARLIGVAWNSVARWERDEMDMKTPTEKLIRLLGKTGKAR
jgi:DNA-binding transcriptional regulator YiaG